MVGVGRSETQVSARVFFESGSQWSFISTSLAQQLGLNPVSTISLTVKVFGQCPESITLPIVKVPVRLGRRMIKLKLLVHDNVNTPIVVPGIKTVADALKMKGVSLADGKINSDTLEDVHLLIGVDYMDKYLFHRERYEGVQLWHSPGGAVIYGPLPRWAVPLSTHRGGADDVHLQSVLCGHISSDAEPNLAKLWELDQIGLSSETLTPQDQAARDQVTSSITRIANQYCVKLPFQSEERPPTNFMATKCQLDSLYRNKLNKDNQLKSKYAMVIEKYKDARFIEPVPLNPQEGHFLPHHLVLKESETTPLRIVYNASSKKQTSKSLNDCLLSGPSLTALLYDKLIKFRGNSFAVIANIEKAFHRILVAEEDRKFLKFLT